MEVKRLPASGNNRVKVYVVGLTRAVNPNGEIVERFKLERHGNGLNSCGMLAYVKNDSFDKWLHNTNKWITELLSPWFDVDKLKKITNDDRLAYLSSVAIRQTSELELDHLWIDIIKVKR